MDKEEIEIWKKTLLISAVVLIPAAVIFLVLNPVTIKVGGHNTEKVRKKIRSYLHKKYGKEFIVDRIGIRSSRGQEFYQARIYPKSIVGTNKEGDEYYYARASVDKLSFGRLGGVGDSYELVNLKLDIEDALEPNVKEIFGERVLMKIEAHYKRREPGNEYFWGYKVESYEKAKELIAEDPENRMIELDLDVYVFDRIEDEQEKEKRRKDIFEFVQYLKEEGLFEYLEMAVIFIDERVLAPSYEKYKDKVDYSDKVTKEIDGKTVRVPLMQLREEMSRQLQREVNNMRKEKLLSNMKQIQKEELNKLPEYNAQKATFIYSWGMIKEEYPSSLEERDKNRDYSKLKHVRLGNNLKYIYKD